MSRNAFYSWLISLVFLIVFYVWATPAAAARPPLVRTAKSPKTVEQKPKPSGTVTRAQLRKALGNARVAKSAFIASKKRAKLLIVAAKAPGATRADKKAAIQAVAAVRRDAKWLKAALAKLKSLRSEITVVPKKPLTKKKEVIVKKPVGKIRAAVTKKPASETTTVNTKKPMPKTVPVVSKKPTRTRSIPMMKDAVNTMSKKVVKINGRKLPQNCYCAKQRAGESKCYFFTKGGYCSVRFCAASYACVGRSKSRGTLCLLRRIRTRIVPVRENKCRIQRIDSFMYVPYARY